MTFSRRWIVIVLTLWVILAFPVISKEQEVKIDKSAKIVLIQGNEYYLHKVQKGQTLYSISKTYNVSLDEIYKENKEVENGIKTGQELKIPVHKEGTAVETKPVPAEPKPATPEPKKNGIPEPKVSLPAEKPKADTTHKNVAKKKCEQEPHKNKFNVALMLPLYLSEIDSISTSHDNDTGSPSSYKSLRFIQFYEGFRIALDSLEKAGFSCNLYIYDLDEDSSKVRKILRKPEMEKMNLIIGLLYGNIFAMVSQYATSHNITLVNPLSNKLSYIEGKPNVILANPAVNTMSYEIARYLSLKFEDENLLLIIPEKENEKKSMNKLKENLGKIYALGKTKEHKIKEISSASIDNSTLSSNFVTERKNVVVMLSNDELLVANLFREVKSIDPAYQIVFFGMPGWSDYKSIEPHDLVTFNFHSFANSFIDYQEAGVKTFLEKFRNTYYTEPDENAFKGYDIGFYFNKALFQFGLNFESCLPDFNQRTLGTQFKFKHDVNNGYENSYLNIIKFEDYSLKDAW